MFHLFRSRKQMLRIFLGFVVAAVAIPMVVTLIPGVGSTSSYTDADTVLADVAGESVTIQEARYQLQDEIAQRRVPPGALGFMAPKIVQDLIVEKAMLQEAERLGLGVTDAELVDLLRISLPFLFPNGQFLGTEQYAAFIQDRFQKTIPEFEALLKKDLMLTKLRRLVTDSVTVSPEDVDQEYRRRNEKARIDYVAISTASVQSSVSVSPDEVQQHFQQNRTAYLIPERRSIQYMVVDDAKVASQIQVSPQDLQRYYNENRDRYRVQDRVHATHILFKTAEKKEDEVKHVEAKAQDILKQVRAGKDFAELAKANSEDTVSATKGGDIGWVTKGQTVPEFEQKVFSMKPGEISDLVKTQYGYHIVKVLEKENARIKPFTEVEPTIRQELTRERVETERARLAERARTAASRTAPNLDPAGKEVGLPVLTATMIERSMPLPEAGSEPALMDALFTATKGSVVGPITLASKSVIAVVTDIAPTRQAELAEMADRVKSDATAAKAREVAQARAKELAEKAKSRGGDLDKAAKELKLHVKTSETFTREGSIPGVGTGSMLGEAFTAPIGTVLGPVSAGADQIVYKVIERIPPDASASADEKNRIKEIMLGTRQNEAFEVFKDDLRERLTKAGKIKVHQDRLDRFVTASR